MTAPGGTGRVHLKVAVERASDVPLTVTATVCGVTATGEIAAGECHAAIQFTVDDAPLWWPRGYGEQPLLPARRSPWPPPTASCSTHGSGGSGSVAVRLDTTPDAYGTPFTLVVNDVPVFVRGVNWIPDDAFVTRVDPGPATPGVSPRRARPTSTTCGCGAAGSTSPTTSTTSPTSWGCWCGRTSCSPAPRTRRRSRSPAEVDAEARDNVVRLASHPSLVLWNGNNENIWGYYDWGWQPALGRAQPGAPATTSSCCPAIVAELDPTRPYWPGSPYSGSHDRAPQRPGARHHAHLGRVEPGRLLPLPRLPYPDSSPSSAYQAPPAYATLRRGSPTSRWRTTRPACSHHQKAIDGDGKLRRGLAAHLPVPRDFDDWHYLTQLNQARAVSVGGRALPLATGRCAWARSSGSSTTAGRCTSWAAIDGDGRRKPLWYALRRAFADQLLTIQPRESGLALVAVNEGAGDWAGDLSVVRHNLAGEPLATHLVELRVPARSAVTVAIAADVAAPGDPGTELLRASLGGLRAYWFFAQDKDIRYPEPRFTTEVLPAAGGLAVTVTAETILRDLVLFPDRLDPAAYADDAVVTLLPGESARFTVYTDLTLDKAALSSRPVLRCVNDITSPVQTG